VTTVNEIVTKYKTQGSEKVVKETDRIGKAQTRLGQGSASAGRSFSSQAQGLGGLVGIYAAAAANVFAISAAFAALNRAAQFETIIRGTEQLAAAVGSSATVVVSELKRVTQGQLSVIEAATQANLALSAGFNTDQISQLGEVANKAAKALGRNLTDAFQRITRGAIKLEPELLDEIGIFTRIEPAVEAYALQLGKSVSQLTQFERRQAFVNQVIKDGQQAFQDVDISGQSTQATFEKLVANFTDLALVVGQFVADSLVPFAEFLDKNLGNRLILLGGIATLVFSALGKAVGGTAVAAFTRLGDALNRTADGFSLTKAKAAEFSEKAKGIGQQFVGGGLIRGERGAGAEIKRDLSSGTISTQRALEIREKIPDLIKAEQAEQVRLKGLLKDTNTDREKTNRLIAQSVQRTKGLVSTQKLVKEQIDASGKAAIGFAGGLRVAGKAAAFVATQIGNAFRLLQTLLIAFTTLQTVLSFFDIDFFEILKTLITGIGKEARDAAKGVEQLANSTELVRSKFEGLGKVAKENALEQFTENADANVNAIDTEIRKLERDLETLTSGSPFGKFIKFLTTDDVKIAKLIEEIRGKIAGLREAADPASAKIVALGSAFVKLQEATGKSKEVLSTSIDSERIVKDGDKLIAKLNNIEVTIGSFQGKIAVLGDKGLVKLGQALVEAGDKSDKLFNTLIEGGNISAERASRDFGTIISLLNQAKKAAEDANNVDLANQIGAEIDKASAKVGKLVGEFTTLDALNKQLGKEFSGEFKFLDDRFLKGIASAETGKIAKNTQEQLKFRSQNVALLQKQVDAENNNLVPNGTKLAALEEIISKVRKKAQADLIKQVPLLEKQRKELEKSTRQLEAQVKLLTLQNDVLENQIESQARLDNLRLKIEDQKNAVKIQQQSLDLTKQQLSNAEKLRDAEIDRLRAAENIRKAQASAGISVAQAAAGLADKQGDQAIIDARNKAAQFERENVLSRRSILNNQIELARIERDEGLARLKRQEDLLILETVEKNRQLEEQAKIIEAQGRADVAKINDQIDILAREESLRLAQIEARKAEEKSQLETIKAAKDNIRDQKEIALLQAKQQKDARDAQLNLLLEQAKLQKAKIEADLLILKGQERIVKEQAKNVGRTFTGLDLDIDGGIGTQLKSITDNITAINNQFSISEEIFGQSVRKAELNATKGINAETIKENILNKSITSSGKLDTIQAELFKSRLEQLITERNAIIAATQAALASGKIRTAEQLALANLTLGVLSAERDALQKVYQEIVNKGEAELSYAQTVTDAIKSSKAIVANELSAAFSKLNDALVEGTLNAKNFRDGITDFVGGTLKKVQQDFFKRTIADPAAEFLSDSLFTGLGLQTEKKGADALTYTGNSANVNVTNLGKGKAIADVINKDSDSVFNKIGDKIREFGDSASNTFDDLGRGLSDTFSSIISSLGSAGASLGASTGGLFDSILSGASNLFGVGPGPGMSAITPYTTLSGVGVGTSGGFVPFSAYQRLAAGGMMRDRVPALLEPGEFVMKRSSARSIGEGNLNAMNATGQMGGNVSVNIVNQGTPQEATQQTQPRFDGEKFVIDIVTRDLRNNGPIRKSLRGAT